MAARKAPATKVGKAKKKPRGGQSLYTPAIGKAIIDRLSKGEPLAVICRDKGMPAVRTVSLWKESHPGFDADFACAREEGHDAIAAECLEIADDASRDVTLSEDGKESVDYELVQRSKLRIETRLKLLAKWSPRKYGDKLEVIGKLTLEQLVGASTQPE